MYDKLANIDRLVDNEVTDGLLRQLLKLRLKAVDDFRKSCFREHVCMNDQPSYHVLHYFIKNKLTGVTVCNTQRPVSSNCDYCLSPFQVLSDVSYALALVPAGVHSAYNTVNKMCSCSRVMRVCF